MDGIPAIQIVFFRSIVTLILSYIAIKKSNLTIMTSSTPLLLLRGLAGAIALGLYFYTIQVMPLASAVTILYLAPIFTVLIAIVLLKEYPTKKQIPFFILCFIGVALIKNIDPRVSLIHLLMGVTAAFFAGLAYNVIRMLKGKVDTNIIIFYFPLVTIPLCLPLLIPSWVTPNFKQLFLLILIGVFTQIAQVFMTKAYISEKASKISHYNYMTVVWAFLCGILFFNEHLNIVSILGLILVFIGMYFSTYFADKN